MGPWIGRSSGTAIGGGLFIGGGIIINCVVPLCFLLYPCPSSQPRLYLYLYPGLSHQHRPPQYLIGVTCVPFTELSIWLMCVDKTRFSSNLIFTQLQPTPARRRGMHR